MKVKFGTNDDSSLTRAILFSFFGTAAIATCMVLGGVVTSCHEFINDVKNPNTTSSGYSSQCHDRLYETCLCDAMANLTQNLNICLNNLQIQSARILPLVAYVLQVFAVRESFALEGNHSRTVVRVAWFMFPFILIMVELAIYWENCSHLVTVCSLFISSLVVLYFVLHEMVHKGNPSNFHEEIHIHVHAHVLLQQRPSVSNRAGG